MCGVSAALGRAAGERLIKDMVDSQHHRGPDAQGVFVDPDGRAVLGHNRLSIIDLSNAGAQPMVSADGRYALAFNGEVYNHRELRAELRDYPFRSACDTEVVLAAWAAWGAASLSRLVGMFAFVIWDTRTGEAHLVRDRFGVKPLYLAETPDGGLLVASEIKGIHAAGFPRQPDISTWATYLVTGRQELADRTFWSGVRPVPPGVVVTWQGGSLRSKVWYDLAAEVGVAEDDRGDEEVAEEWLALARESIEFRFRSDVPVGVNLSGGVDSSFLLAALHAVQGADSAVEAFTFITGDPAYDELPWVNELLSQTRHPSVVVELRPQDVPDLSQSVALFQDEPYGGIPTLAYAKLFASARERGIVVLLDGQGLDEQWGGYDYYRSATRATEAPIVQGTSDAPTRAEAVLPEALDSVVRMHPLGQGDPLRAMQIRDLTRTKIPRALRFNDRVSMRSSCELREPFLDHRLVELALRQPAARKVSETQGKVFLRQTLADYLPGRVVEAPKRPLQTPQREWLRGPLSNWATDMIELGLAGHGSDLLDGDQVREQWRRYLGGEGDNSFFVWQWVSLGLVTSI